MNEICEEPPQEQNECLYKGTWQTWTPPKSQFLFCSYKDNSTVKNRCPTISTLIAEPGTVKQELSLTSKELNHKLLFPDLEHDWLQEGNQQLLPQQSKNRTWESPQRFWRTELLWSPVSQQAESPIRSSGAERIRWWHLNTQQDLGITKDII